MIYTYLIKKTTENIYIYLNKLTTKKVDYFFTHLIDLNLK